MAKRIKKTVKTFLDANKKIVIVWTRVHSSFYVLLCHIFWMYFCTSKLFVILMSRICGLLLTASTYTFSRARVRASIRVRIRTHVYLRVCVRACACVCARAYVHTYVRTYVGSCVVHTCTRAFPFIPPTITCLWNRTPIPLTRETASVF